MSRTVAQDTSLTLLPSNTIPLNDSPCSELIAPRPLVIVEGFLGFPKRELWGDFEEHCKKLSEWGALYNGVRFPDRGSLLRSSPSSEVEFLRRLP